MKTRDPFLSTFGIVLDRLAVWLILVMVAFVLLWSAVCERGLGQTWAEAMRQLYAVLTGHAEPISTMLAALSLAVAVLFVNHVAVWLFTRWRRQAELGAMHVRGSRLED